MKNNSRSAQSRILKRLTFGLSYCLSLASVLAISAEAMAQPLPGRIATPGSLDAIAQQQTVQKQAIQTPTAQTQVAQSSPETSPTASEVAALRLQPFFNLNHTEGAGFTGFTSVGGFLPLFQTPGQNVTFLDGRVSVDNDGNFGGGLQAGYRTLLNDDIIWGVFAGVDARGTDTSTFTQANAGAELLGENWDVTLNANLPLGNARQVISSDTQAVNPQFTGNQLLIDEQKINQVEAALTTVSLDGGLELLDLGGGGSLWGRGGVYFLGGEASEDSLGFRAALDYRPTNSLRVGVGVQNDGIFDTNVTFSVNALLGARSRRSYDAEENPTTEENLPSQLWARAAEPIARTNTVLVENKTDVEIVQSDVTAINPETDQAFVFRHVDPDAAPPPIVLEEAIPAEGLIEIEREGTFEDPFNTIAQAANVADVNADNIIFVQQGNAGGRFTLPDGVQVRSVGPLQPLNTQFGEVILPGSGSGNLATVTGTATIGSNTLVSGLEINPNARRVEEAIGLGAEPIEAIALERVVHGIVGRGENITLEDNVITNVNQGINLPDIDGTVTIVRNQISNTALEGIAFGDINGTDNTTITVANNTLDTIGSNAIDFGLIEGDAIANITVANNQITNAQFNSIFFDDIQGNAVATVAVSGNVINAEGVNPDEAGGDGILINRIENNANATITVNENQISNVAFEGIDIEDIEDDAVANITVANNQVVSNETGIEVEDIENRANATISVVGNTITVAEEEGIFFNDIEDDTVSNITIENNTILGAGEQGIEFDFIEDNANATINILNNQISNVGDEGIFFDDIQETTTAVITVDGNTITDAGDDGIEFSLIEDSANVTVTVTNNTIINPGTQYTPVNNPGDFPSVVIDPPNTDDDEPDEDDLEELAASVNVVANVTAAEATIAPPEPDGDGVRITHTEDANICLALDNNTVINPASDGFELISNGAGQFQIVDLANVPERNVGSFNPADIETNDDFVNGTAGEAACP